MEPLSPSGPTEEMAGRKPSTPPTPSPGLSPHTLCGDASGPQGTIPYKKGRTGGALETRPYVRHEKLRRVPFLSACRGAKATQCDDMKTVQPYF